MLFPSTTMDEVGKTFTDGTSSKTEQKEIKLENK